MKNILLSVRPKWTAKILSGEKTIEIRKSAPKCDLPVTVYIYCTKGSLKLFKLANGEYCAAKEKDIEKFSEYSGKVVAKFTLKKVDEVQNCGSGFYVPNESLGYTNELAENSCLDFVDMKKYAGSRKSLYAWHISDLVVFDKPLELNNFVNPNDKYFINGKEYMCRLHRPPQSWQFIEPPTDGREG